MNKIPSRTIQILLDEARYLDTKPVQNHNMNCVIQNDGCGTTSCAFGDIAIRNINDERLKEAHIFLGRREGFYDIDFESGNLYGSIAEYLDITANEARFLFEDDFETWSKNKCRFYEQPKQTAARIRKFVYYKLRKQELLSTDEVDRHGKTAYDYSRDIGHIGVNAELCNI